MVVEFGSIKICDKEKKTFHELKQVFTASYLHLIFINRKFKYLRTDHKTFAALFKDENVWFLAKCPQTSSAFVSHFDCRILRSNCEPCFRGDELDWSKVTRHVNRQRELVTKTDLAFSEDHWILPEINEVNDNLIVEFHNEITFLLSRVCTLLYE